MSNKIFTVIYVIAVVCAGCNPEEAVWNDEFTDLNSRWAWNYNKGTSYKRLTKIDGASVVEIGITDQSSSSGYSDCSLHEDGYQYHNGVFEARHFTAAHVLPSSQITCRDSTFIVGWQPPSLRGEWLVGWHALRVAYAKHKQA